MKKKDWEITVEEAMNAIKATPEWPMLQERGIIAEEGIERFLSSHPEVYKRVFRLMKLVLIEDREKHYKQFINFLLSFPENEWGEQQILAFFSACDNWFRYFLHKPIPEPIQLILSNLGDIQEDGGTHGTEGMCTWIQVRRALNEWSRGQRSRQAWYACIEKQFLLCPNNEDLYEEVASYCRRLRIIKYQRMQEMRKQYEKGENVENP